MKYLIILLVVILGGCKIDYDPANNIPIQSAQINYVEDEESLRNIISLIVVDSCEYVVYGESYGRGAAGGITHKGNCKFCQQRKIQSNDK